TQAWGRRMNRNQRGCDLASHGQPDAPHTTSAGGVTGLFPPHGQGLQHLAVAAVDGQPVQMAFGQPPTRDEIDALFTAVLAGIRTRDEAARWAAQSPTVRSPTRSSGGLSIYFTALTRLPPEGASMHDDKQVRQWLGEFRDRCRILPAREDA